MSKFSEMAAPLAGKFGLTVKDAEQFLLQMTEVLNDGLREDKQVKIKGMGTFKVTSVSARKSVNVNTGEPIVISSRDKITFTPDASLRDRVNSPFAQFETVVVNDGVELEESISTASHLSPQREAEQQPPSPASQPELSTLTEETPAEPETSIPSKKTKGRYRAWFGTVALSLAHFTSCAMQLQRRVAGSKKRRPLRSRWLLRNGKLQKSKLFPRRKM